MKNISRQKLTARHLAIVMQLVAVLVSSTASSPAQTAGLAANSSLYTYGIEINVDDMDKALAFYQGKLGFEIEDRSHYPRYVVLKSDDREKLILNRVNRLRKRGPSDTDLSFTLQVNDLDQSIEKMKALGVALPEKQPRKEAVGNAIYISDPFGRLISLMHQTIVKVEPFKEPKLYNFGVTVPDMQIGRDFYANKLGFVVRSEKYLPLDLPLGHADKTFAFMLHYRPGVTAINSDFPQSVDFNTAVFAARDLDATVERLKKSGVKIVEYKRNSAGPYVIIQDPFGNISKLIQVK